MNLALNPDISFIGQVNSTLDPIPFQSKRNWRLILYIFFFKGKRIWRLIPLFTKGKTSSLPTS
jgi:hypothetical protein